MRLECAALACSGAMAPGMNLKRPAEINWWNQRLISPARCSRWSVIGHSRPKDASLSPACVLAIQIFSAVRRKDVDAHDVRRDGARRDPARARRDEKFSASLSDFTPVARL